MKRSSILIVEDDRWLAEQFWRTLDKADFNPHIASNGLEAIQMVDDIRPAAIILDVLLPGSTAFAFLHELQSYSDTGNIPIILCTNLASDFRLEDLKAYGVRCLIDKSSMQPSSLVEAVKGVL